MTKEKVTKVQIEKEVINMTKEQKNSGAQEITNKVMEMVAAGVSMQEALVKVLGTIPQVVTPRITDRVAYISSLTDLQELRRAIKTSFATASNARKNNSAVAEENAMKVVKAGQARVNSILAEIETNSNPYPLFREHNEEPSKIVSFWMTRADAALDRKITVLFAKAPLSKKALKEKITSQEVNWNSTKLQDIMLVLDADEQKAFGDRMNNGDQWAISIIRKAQLVSSIVEATK